MADEERAKPAPKAVPSPGAGGGGLKLIVVAVAMTALTCISGFLAWRLYAVQSTLEKALSGKGEAAVETEATEATDETEETESDEGAVETTFPLDGGLIALDEFIVNLADPDARRFLRTKVQLVMSSKKDSEQLKKSEVVVPKIRDLILNHLANQRSADLSSDEGRKTLRLQLAEQISTALGGVAVADVLFTDFVVQY
jgi:flagellar FliL protein